MQVTIEKAKGYTGKYAAKSWVARLTGVTASGKFEREFLQADNVDWGNSKLYKTGKGTWTETYELTPGLYEVCEYGEAEYLIVYDRKDGRQKRASTERGLLTTIKAIQDARLDIADVLDTFSALVTAALEAGGEEAVKAVRVYDAVTAMTAEVAQ